MSASQHDSGLRDTYDQKYRQQNYFQYREWLYRRFVQALVRRAGLAAGGSVLDAGCGQGFFSWLFSGLGFRTTGVDLSPEGIAAAQRQYGKQVERFLVGDVMDLPFVDCFDCVFTRSCSLYNDATFASRTDATDRLLSYVKPGGVFIFDYYSKLSARKSSDSWRYHSLDDLRRHFARYPGATILFSLRFDALLLGSLALREPVSSLSAAASRWSGLGGELVAIVRRRDG